MAPLEQDVHNDTDFLITNTLKNARRDQNFTPADRKDSMIRKDSDSSRRVSVCLPPMQLTVLGMVNHKVAGGNCKKLVTGGILQENVKCIIVSTEWFHNLEGASRLILTLYDNLKRVQKRIDVFGKPPKRGFTAYRYFSHYEPIVALAKPGYFYQLEIKVAKGQEDAVTLAGLVCKVIPSSAIGESFDFIDQEGVRGRYRGEALNGKPDGKGVIDYESGRTFVGFFVNGKWSKGVEYHGNDVICTMLNGMWNDEIDMALAKEFDYKVHFFIRPTSKSKKVVAPAAENTKKASDTSAFCGAFACLS